MRASVSECANKCMGEKVLSLTSLTHTIVAAEKKQQKEGQWFSGVSKRKGTGSLIK